MFYFNYYQLLLSLSLFLCYYLLFEIILTLFIYYYFKCLFIYLNVINLPVRWMDYLGKGEVPTNTDLDRFVNNIWGK